MKPHSTGTDSRTSSPVRFAEKRAPRVLQLAVILVIALLFILGSAQSGVAQEQAKKLVALLDYLGSDYKNAVKDGKVLNNDEYGEMQEFAKRGRDLFNQLKEIDKGDKAGVESTLQSLAA